MMEIDLSAAQCRVIGVLLEKEVTTPEQYPLSLNALSSACNQKSNRDPVTEYSDAEVQDVVEQLKQKRFVSDAPLSGRVVRYQHRFCNTPFGGLQLSEQQRALVCLLLLRGPQTPGELRTRSQRLAEFTTVAEVEQGLVELQQQSLVLKLAREPGKRESRYAHLFSAESPGNADEIPAQISAVEGTQGLQDQIDQLKNEVEQLKQQVAKLVDDKSAWLQ